MPNPTAAMLTIGDEILSGRTRDSNMPHLAAALVAKGIALRETRVVPDVEAEIVAAVNALRARYTTSSPRAASARPTTTSPPTRSPPPSASAIDVREDARAILARQLRQPGGRAEPGAPAHGAHPRRRRR